VEEEPEVVVLRSDESSLLGIVVAKEEIALNDSVDDSAAELFELFADTVDDD
jgi:hypothetical protein